MRSTLFPAVSFLVIITSCTSVYERFATRSIRDLSLNADSIAVNTDYAKEIWTGTPWAKEYTEEILEEYVLPPRIADEPIEYWWRADIPRWLELKDRNEASLYELAVEINSKIDIAIKTEAWSNPQMGYSKTMSGLSGKCDDRAILLAMAFRSFGIPAAFDFIPNWGRKNNGHSFCSVIQSDWSVYVFQDRRDKGTAAEFSDIPPKIYRRTFFEQQDNLIYRWREKEFVPDQFRDCRFQDVTKYHKIRCRDVQVNLDFKAKNKLAYLAVFTPQGWIPVAYGEIKANKAVFEDVGMNILYLPCIYDGINQIPISEPFIVDLSDNKKITISNEEVEDVVLTRKYPKSERVELFAGYMDGGVFEVACSPDFSDAVPVFRVDGKPFSHMQGQDCHAKGRYARYRKPSGIFSIGEMAFRTPTGEVLGGEIILPSGMEGMPGIGNIIDGNVLSYLELTGLTDVWVGLDFGQEVEIGRVEFCPRTDDNDISPGDLYELLYWSKNEWKTLGIKIAEGYEVGFSGVPVGALLWLRNLTKGKEERPFLYDKGEQLWL